MIKNNIRYRWQGREPSTSWIFKVDHPCELMGVHAELIDHELGESEKIEYCLYSPAMASASVSPLFGLKGKKASHGLCVTNQRIIVSTNSKTHDAEPFVEVVDFKDILYLNLGTALLLSWFSLRYRGSGFLKNLTVLFNSTGREHFENALRTLKKYWDSVSLENFETPAFPPSNFVHKIDDDAHREELRTLLCPDEQCLFTFCCDYLWDVAVEKTFPKRKKYVNYITSKSTLLLTTKALHIARNDTEKSNYHGIDLLSVPLERIEACCFSENETEGRSICQLKLLFNQRSMTDELAFSFMPQDRKTGEMVKRLQIAIQKLISN